MALQHDLQQSRQALEASLPHAERDRQLLLKAAHSKLDLALLTALPVAAAAHDTPTTPPEQQQQQQQQQAESSSQDSSCSSSVCGSSCTTGSSSSLGAGSGGAGSQRQAPNPRLVATRSKLGYTAHWALKVAL